jgi:hypothetical protein
MENHSVPALCAGTGIARVDKLWGPLPRHPFAKMLIYLRIGTVNMTRARMNVHFWEKDVVKIGLIV